jgi:Zn finger protein HypA/HybF involved in hydrogenase expression
MTDVLAREKHACPACGAQAEWDPASQRLVCPFCGTESPYVFDRDTGKIQEIDLVSALRELPDELRGWGLESRSVQCQSCKAVMVFAAERVGQNCEFCGSPALVPYEEIKAPITPQSLLPFRVGTDRVRDDLRRWFASRWFAPGSLKRRALVDTVRSLYVPYWTFDAKVHCRWEAEAGHYYYVREEVRDARGRPQVRQVRKVRWEPAAGALDHFFDDEPVPGTRGMRTDLIRQIEPFPTGELVPYDTGYLSGHVVEHYQVVLVEAANMSREAMREKLTEMCGAQVPGDTYRNLRIFPEFSNPTFKHVLVPVWFLAYTLGARAYQVAVNGYTGKIAGDYPKSPWKIALLVLLGVVALALVLLNVE